MKSIHDMRGAVRAAKKRLNRAAKCAVRPAFNDAFDAYSSAVSALYRAHADRLHRGKPPVTVARWIGYLEADELQEAPYSSAHHEALISEIRSRGLAFSGCDHQNLDDCVPVFSDGTVRTHSMRGWGDVMAEAHGDTGCMAYCKWAWEMPEGVERVLP